MTIPDPEYYDHLFPEVRAALVTDIGYSIAIAKAAHTFAARAEAQYQRRAAREAATTPNVGASATDNVPQTQGASD